MSIGRRKTDRVSDSVAAGCTRIVASVLRDFRPSEQRELRELILAGLHERWGDAFDSRCNPDLQDVVTNYLNLGAEIVVVESNGELVATGMLARDDVDTARIVRVSVAASHRRQGLARSVIEELIRRARLRGMSEVRVGTDTPWTSAVALYGACGFTEIGTDETDTHFVMSL